ncbi:MAG TPA: hypothetical protein VIS49_03330 [Cyclobacteriaceae bacterium]
MKATLFIILSTFFFQFAAMAQAQEEKIRAFEIQKEAARQQKLSAQLDSAIYLSANGEYQAADDRFRVLLKSMRSISSDLVYHFGKNSFHLGKYKQSVDWLNKYIQLKGTSGQYSQEAVDWLKKAEAELLKEKREQSKQAAQVLSQDYDIDCGPTGKVTCPVCKGSTVIVKKGYMENTYKTCPYCKQKGFLDCDDYNLLLKGKLEPATTNR